MFTKFNNIFIFETDTQSKTLITVVTWFSPKVPCQSKLFQYARCLATLGRNLLYLIVVTVTSFTVNFREEKKLLSSQALSVVLSHLEYGQLNHE